MPKKLYIKTGSRYKLASPGMIAEAAGDYMDAQIESFAMVNSTATINFLRKRLVGHERENFGVMYLDNKHRVIEFKIMFQGTVNRAAVYPREVVKHALAVNASAVIFAHNHPSGDSVPSQPDRIITDHLKDALSLVDIKVLDHIVIGAGMEEYTAFSDMGWI